MIVTLFPDPREQAKAIGVYSFVASAGGSIGLLNLRYGPRATLIPSLVAIGAGLLLFARAPVNGSYVADVLPVMLLLGAGAGLAAPSLMTLAMSGATESDAGLASGLVNTTVQVGGAIGLAVLATLASERTGSELAAGAGDAVALNAGFHLAYLIGAALVAVAVVVAVVVLRSPAAEPVPVTSRTAAEHA
jgi:MFS family permease